jgi:5-bromo-4-chloroindolyl phosphate hydrolysis protein
MAGGRRIGTLPRKKPGAWLLYTALAPLFVSTMVSLFAGEYRAFLLKLGGFALWSLSAALVSRGIRARAAYDEAAVAKAPTVPMKALGAVTLGIGVFYLGWIVGGASLWQALFVGALAGAGVVLYYGPDPMRDKLPESADVNPELLLRSLTEARDRLEEIRLHAKEIRDLRLHREIEHAVDKAEEILDTIAEDPKDLRVARKVLVVYIDGVGRVTERYRALEESEIDAETRERLYTLLREVQERFDRELERLRSNDCFDLDVQIDALRRQIKE